MAIEDLPERTMRRLPEYAPSEISLSGFKGVLCERILDAGSREEARWLFSTYPLEEIAAFLLSPRARRVSPVSLTFWCRFFRLLPPRMQKNPLWEP